MRELVFVDCETTGLEDVMNVIVELSYATERSEIKSLYFGVTEVPEFVDNLIGFTERNLAGRYSESSEIKEFLDLTESNTMVSANPPFDRYFLKQECLWNFHYRSLDIESYAMKPLGLNFVPGMKDIYDALTSLGYDIPTPEHTGPSDVAALRAAFQILRYM